MPSGLDTIFINFYPFFVYSVFSFQSMIYITTSITTAATVLYKMINVHRLFFAGVDYVNG